MQTPLTVSTQHIVSPGTQRAVSRYTPRRVLGYVLVYALMIPLLWMFSASIKNRQDILAYPPTLLPASPNWSNYGAAFARYPLAQFMFNTFFLIAANSIGYLVSVPIIAYTFARLRFPGKSILFVLMLSTMMIPGQIKLIPLFKMYSSLGMIDTYFPLILPSFFGDAFFIFLMIQYIWTIPRDLDEAARIDGAGTWMILYRVILPLCKPILTVMLVYTFLWTWNEFWQPLIFLNSFDKYPISVGLAFFRGRYGVEWNLLMSATLVSIMPVLILYFFAQRHLLGGLAAAGLKG